MGIACRSAIATLLAVLAGCTTTPAVAPIPPPASIVLKFDDRAVLNSHVDGVADRATGRALTLDDPVRIASISKLVVALGVMRMVEAGVLDLDRDVSDYLGWRPRHPGFPDRPVTLRLLLSHTAGVRDGIDYALPLDVALEAALADPAAWDSAHGPGDGWFTYANLNFPIIAAVMEAADGERFDRLMARRVFTPLGLDACFNWTTCSDAAVERAVVLYRANGDVARDDLHGQRPACPVGAARDGGCDLDGYLPGRNGAVFSPQGGLRISAQGLVRLGQMLLRGGEDFLRPASITMMITPQWRFDGRNGDTDRGLFCGYGLGVHVLASAAQGCNDDPFGDGHARIGHPGEAYGLKSGLYVDRVSGQGVVWIATQVPEDEPRGQTAFYAVEERLLARLAPGTTERP